MTNQLRLLFLFVVISGALCTVEDYVIMSQCAHNKAINLAAEGTVSVTDISQIQNITIVGRPDFVNNNFKIALYAKETQRYLCFNDHWKLVGMKELQDTCYFNEAIVHGYFVFRSVVDLQRRIGFTQKGRAVGPKKVVNDACYMFTKIPTDQFFHQHSHFPAPNKSKSTTTTTTTTRIPKTEYNYSSNVGRGSGSGGGRSKTNRHKNSQRKDDLVTSNHSGHGSGNGHGSGGGSGSGNGHKKFKKQRNGYKQQRRQQQQQQFRGHSYNLSNPKNSTYLNSSRQNLVLSQHSHTNNYTNNKNYNNNSNSNNSNSNPPQNHQVRHHHNDPNKVARRQQHDQKQKHIKLRQRVRPSPAPSASNDTSVVTVATSTTTTSTTLHKAINSSKPHTTQSSTYSDIKPTNVVPTLTMDNQSDSRNTMASSSVVVAKRKGRRRKGDKVHKKNLQRLREQEQEQEHTNKDNLYSSTSIGPNYEEMHEEEFMTTSTDYAWMTNDIMLSSVKPTSASLPTWETWYPSSSTLNTDENTEYSSASSVTEMNNNDKHFSTTLASSSMTTDLAKNTLSAEQIRQQQTTSVSLPTYELSTTLTENSIDETISPTVTTDLGMTTTNTSTYTQTDFWSTSLNDDNTETDMTSNSFTRQTFNTYATPQLQDTLPTLKTEQTTNWEDTNTNTLSTHNYRNDGDEENSTLDLNLTAATEEDEEHEEEEEEEKLNEVSSPASDKVSDTTSPEEGSTSEMTSSSDYDKTSEITDPTTSTLTNDCAYSTASTHSGSENMTDCSKVATKTLATIANKHPQTETSPTPQTIHHSEDSFRTETTTAKLTKISTVTVPTPKLSLLHPLKSLQSDTPLHYLQPIQNSVTLPHNGEFASTPAFSSTLHSTKSPEPPTTLTTRKTLRKSTQRLLATPFHQLTYVRNEAGDIDIDSIDNISIYPEILDNDNDEPLVRPSTSRLTMISGYLPTSATATLPESIRIAKIKINRERKRMLRIRNVGNYA